MSTYYYKLKSPVVKIEYDKCVLKITLPDGIESDIRILNDGYLVEFMRMLQGQAVARRNAQGDITVLTITDDFWDCEVLISEYGEIIEPRQIVCGRIDRGYVGL